MDGVLSGSKEEKGGDKTKKAKNKTKSSDWFFTIISVIITAVVVGGVFYAWQKDRINDSIKKISSDARSTRMDFEKRLSSVKDKLRGVESENEELKLSNKKLLEKAALLEGAKTEFVNNALALSFDYPATFGESKIVMENSSEGKIFKGSFLENEKLEFMGVGEDFSKQSSSTPIELNEISGFIERDDKYLLQIPRNELVEIEVSPAEVIETEKGKAILINNKSIKAEEADAANTINIGENLVAVLNLDADYKNIIFVNFDFGMMSVDEFKAMIKSIRQN